MKKAQHSAVGAVSADAAPADTPNDRRHFIRQLGLLMGGAALTPLMPGLEVALAYAPRNDTLSQDGRVLVQRQLINLRVVCEQTIPATTTPGAADLDVYGFIDHQLAECHGDEDQEKARRALDELEQQAVNTGGQSFSDLSADSQLHLLQALEQGGKPFNEGLSWDFKFMKNLLVFGYFTTREGATQVLRFDPIPGGFRGEVPVPEDGRGWY